MYTFKPLLNRRKFLTTLSGATCALVLPTLGCRKAALPEFDTALSAFYAASTYDYLPVKEKSATVEPYILIAARRLHEQQKKIHSLIGFVRAEEVSPPHDTKNNNENPPATPEYVQGFSSCDYPGARVMSKVAAVKETLVSDLIATGIPSSCFAQGYDRALIDTLPKYFAGHGIYLYSNPIYLEQKGQLVGMEMECHFFSIDRVQKKEVIVYDSKFTSVQAEISNLVVEGTFLGMLALPPAVTAGQVIFTFPEVVRAQEKLISSFGEQASRELESFGLENDLGILERNRRAKNLPEIALAIAQLRCMSRLLGHKDMSSAFQSHIESHEVKHQRTQVINRRFIVKSYESIRTIADLDEQLTHSFTQHEVEGLLGEFRDGALPELAIMNILKGVSAVLNRSYVTMHAPAAQQIMQHAIHLILQDPSHYSLPIVESSIPKELQVIVAFPTFIDMPEERKRLADAILTSRPTVRAA
jgi:hypothetical protein